MVYAFWILLKKAFHISRLQRYFHIYYVSFIVLSFIERSLIHLEFTFAYSVRQESHIISIDIVNQSLQYLLYHNYLLVLKFTFILYQVSIHTWIYFWSPFGSIDPFDLHQHHAVLFPLYLNIFPLYITIIF